MAEGPARGYGAGAAVISKGDVAVLAGKHIITSWTRDKAGVTATIQKQDGLLATVEDLAQLCFESATEDVQTLAGTLLLAEVDDLYGREGQIVDTTGKADARKMGQGAGIVERFEAGCG